MDNYKIRINDGGTFDFFAGEGDTPETTGTINIYGNLNVIGEQSSVGSSELLVEDKTITVNDGESGNGVSIGPDGSYTAGLIVDRGNFTNVKILYDEELEWYNSATGLVDPNLGAFVLKAGGTGGETGSTIGLYTNFIGTFNSNDLVLLGAGDNTGKVTVTNTVDYEKNIFTYNGDRLAEQPFSPDRLEPIGNPNYDDDAIPNIRLMIDYVRDYHLYNFQDEIRSPTQNGDTKVVVSDFDVDSSQISNAKIIIDGSTVAEFYGNVTRFIDLEFANNVIRPRSINGNLELEGNNNGSVQFNTPALFPKYVDPLPGETDPDAPVDGVKIYSKAEADGGTGLFFINENSTQDELISRNKALLYSIIF